MGVQLITPVLGSQVMLETAGWVVTEKVMVSVPGSLTAGVYPKATSSVAVVGGVLSKLGATFKTSTVNPSLTEASPSLAVAVTV